MSSDSSVVESQRRSDSTRSPLLSIHLQSNRPLNFSQFLDNIEATADEASLIEVVVKIDNGDSAMNALLEAESGLRSLRLKYVSTPLPEGFYGLWRSMDDILKICDPNAYFVLNLNDEMRFMRKGWDTSLKNYIGLFPDHIFRLRTSPRRHRNYFDFWEAGFANDTSAIMTKRWIDIGGGWCPCNGPDSFQQCVAFYFGYNARFEQSRPIREIPIEGIELSFHGDNLNADSSTARQRMRGAIKPWFRLMSHRMQEEASRRAEKIRAHIYAGEANLTQFELKDVRSKRIIQLSDSLKDEVVAEFPYGISRAKIAATNLWRWVFFPYYGGERNKARQRSFMVNLLGFLALRYDFFDRLRGRYSAILKRGG